MLRILTLVSVVTLSTCSQQEAKSIDNAIFTVEQGACIALNVGVFGDTNAVQELDQLCNIAPALNTQVQNMINSFGAQKAAKEAAAKK